MGMEGSGLTANDTLIRSFLLGELAEEQRESLEARLFSEDDFYADVLAVQEELADDYVRGDLTAKERSQLQDYFARSPRRQERLEFATALAQAMEQPGVLERTEAKSESWLESFSALLRPGWAYAATAAALVLFVIAGWLLIQNRRLSSGIEQARGERDSLQQRSTADQQFAERKAKELEEQIAALKTEGGQLKTDIDQKEKELEYLRRASTNSKPLGDTTLSTFILTPGLTRGNDEPEKLIIPSSAKALRIQLDLEREEKYRGFVAEIRTARGNLVWSHSGLTMHRTNYGQAVAIVVPANVLSNGEYEVTLKGVSGRDFQAVGYYYFITQRR